MNRKTRPDEKQRELPLFVEEAIAVPDENGRVYLGALRFQYSPTAGDTSLFMFKTFPTEGAFDGEFNPLEPLNGDTIEVISAIIPEPSSVMLAAAGLLIMIARRR